jgi:hypothetical protein
MLRGLALVTVLALTTSLCCSHARADACKNATARYNAASALFNAEYAAKFLQIVGRPVSAFELPKECRQAIKLRKWRLQKARSLLLLWNAFHAHCPNAFSKPGVAPYTAHAFYTPPELIERIHKQLAEGCPSRLDR